MGYGFIAQEYFSVDHEKLLLPVYEDIKPKAVDRHAVHDYKNLMALDQCGAAPLVQPNRCRTCGIGPTGGRTHRSAPTVGWIRRSSPRISWTGVPPRPRMRRAPSSAVAIRRDTSIRPYSRVDTVVQPHDEAHSEARLTKGRRL